jgi:structural maintenance of chromosome 4
MEESNETLVPENGAANDCEMAQSEADEAQTNEQAKTERLMIHKMVNENFKSYAGTQELGPFHKVCSIKRIKD